MPIGSVVNEQEGWEGAFLQFEDDDPEYVISFQRTLNPDEQDVAHGMDKVAVIYYGATAYGGIRGWELLDNDEIRITLSSEAAQTLDTDEITDMVVEGAPDLTAIYEHVRNMLTATGEWSDVN